MKLTEMPDLSRFTHLKQLFCNHNNLKSVGNLPNNLIQLNCENNYLEHLEKLPRKLEILFCDGNFLTNLHGLPATLKVLSCSNNDLGKSLNKELIGKNKLEELNCDDESIPKNLPRGLKILNEERISDEN